MGRRTVLLVVALIVAALGTTMVFLYVNGVDERAVADQKPVQVLVAVDTINAGTTAQDAQDAGALRARNIASKYVVRDAVGGIDDIADQVALAPIFPGEQILRTKFGEVGSTGGLLVPGGKIAMSVQLTDPQRVAGWVVPGSNVAIFVSLAGGDGQGTTRALLPTVEVLATGGKALGSDSSGDGENSEATPETLLTLAVDQKQAQRLMYASEHGQLYFALLGNDSKVDPKDGGANAQNLFDE